MPDGRANGLAIWWLSFFLDRVWPSITTLPDARGWREAGLLGGVFLVIAGVAGVGGGLLAFEPVSLRQGLITAAVALVAPAFLEELFFRGYLPEWSATSAPRTWLVLSTAAFILWHVVQVVGQFGPADPFLRFDFLAIAALLGLVCAVLRMRTGSLWPGVLLHWIAVTLWLTLFGGLKAVSELA